MSCGVKRIQSKRLCAGDLRHRISIVRRDLQAGLPGSFEPVETFTEISKAWAGIETSSAALNGVRRFDSVNTDELATHLFYVRHTSTLATLEPANHFVEYSGRRFRILDVVRAEEARQMVIIRATERGESEQEATQA